MCSGVYRAIIGGHLSLAWIEFLDFAAVSSLRKTVMFGRSNGVVIVLIWSAGRHLGYVPAWLGGDLAHIIPIWSFRPTAADINISTHM
jgi:hypothetical protein